MSDSYLQIFEATWKEGIESCFRKEQFSLTNTGIVYFLNISVTRECLDLFKHRGKCCFRRDIALDCF